MNRCFLLLFLVTMPARGASWQQHPEPEQDYTKPRVTRGRTSYLALTKNDIDVSAKESKARVANEPNPIAPIPATAPRRLAIPMRGGKLIRTDSIAGLEAFRSLPQLDEPPSPIVVSPKAKKVNETPLVEWSGEDMQNDEVWR